MSTANRWSLASSARTVMPATILSPSWTITTRTGASSTGTRASPTPMINRSHSAWAASSAYLAFPACITGPSRVCREVATHRSGCAKHYGASPTLFRRTASTFRPYSASLWYEIPSRPCAMAAAISGRSRATGYISVFPPVLLVS